MSTDISALLARANEQMEEDAFQQPESLPEAQDTRPITPHADAENALRYVQQTGITPEDQGRIDFMSKELNVPADQVAVAPDEYAAQVAEQDLQRKSEILKQYPELQDFFSKPENAALGYDDVDLFTKFADATGISTIGDAWEAGWALVDRADVAREVAAYDLRGEPLPLRLQSKVDMFSARMSQYEHDGGVPGAVTNMLPMLFSTAKWGLAGGLTGAAVSYMFGGVPGGVSGFWVGTAGRAFTIEAGNAFMDYREFVDPSTGKKVKPELVIGGAIVYGLIAGTLEATGSAIVLRPLRGMAANHLMRKEVRHMFTDDLGKEHLTNIGVKVMEASGAEGATEFAQEVSQSVIGEAVKVFEGMHRRGAFEGSGMETIWENTFASQAAWNEWWTAFKAGMQGGGGIVAPQIILAEGHTHMARISNGVDGLRRQMDKFRQLKAASKTARENPDAFREAIEAMKPDAPPYQVDAERLEKAIRDQELGQGPVSLEDLASAVPELTVERIREAADRGEDIEIPHAVMGAYIIGTPLEGAVLPHVRDPDTDISEAELKSDMEETAKAVEELDDETPLPYTVDLENDPEGRNARTAKQEFDEIYEYELEKIIESGAYTPDIAKYAAQQLALGAVGLARAARRRVSDIYVGPKIVMGEEGRQFGQAESQRANAKRVAPTGRMTQMGAQRLFEMQSEFGQAEQEAEQARAAAAGEEAAEPTPVRYGLMFNNREELGAYVLEQQRGALDENLDPVPAVPMDFELLDLDKAMEDQSGSIWALTRPLLPDGAATGAQLYDSLVGELEGERAASVMFSDMGVPGATYMENGERRYIMWDDDSLDVIDGMDPGGMMERTLNQSPRERKGELREKFSGIGPVLSHMTDDEAFTVRTKTGDKLVTLFDEMAEFPEEMAAMALVGEPARGWYKNSADTIAGIFGAEDSPRFTALLAALSPKQSVTLNAENAIRLWTKWIDAGRPTERADVMEIAREAARETVGGNWLPGRFNNIYNSLIAEDPATLVMSGPKVNSFMLNLRHFSNEVTLDSWMALIADLNGISERNPELGKAELSGAPTLAPNDPGKKSWYLAYAATTRKAAKMLTRQTGEQWSAAEVQETVWSWARTIADHRKGKSIKNPQGITIEQLVKAGGVSPEQVADTENFETLFTDGVMRRLLEVAGYGAELNNVDRAIESRVRTDGGDAGGRTTPPHERAGLAQSTFDRRLIRAARRLDAALARRESEGAATEFAPQGDDADIELGQPIAYETLNEGFYSGLAAVVSARMDMEFDRKTNVDPETRERLSPRGPASEIRPRVKKWVQAGAATPGGVTAKVAEYDVSGVDEMLEQMGDDIVTKEALTEFILHGAIEVEAHVLNDDTPFRGPDGRVEVGELDWDEDTELGDYQSSREVAEDNISEDEFMVDENTGEVDEDGVPIFEEVLNEEAFEDAIEAETERIQESDSVTIYTETNTGYRIYATEWDTRLVDNEGRDIDDSHEGRVWEMQEQARLHMWENDLIYDEDQESSEMHDDYSSYVLDGPSDDYQVLLLRLPNAISPKMQQRGQLLLDELAKKYNAPNVEFRNYLDIPDISAEDIQRIEDYVNDSAPRTFNGGHFGEAENNIVAHIRIDRRTLPNGETVLFINEIQTDWHSDPRSKRRAMVRKLSADLDITMEDAGKMVPASFGYRQSAATEREIQAETRELEFKWRDITERIDEERAKAEQQLRRWVMDGDMPEGLATISETPVGDDGGRLIYVKSSSFRDTGRADDNFAGFVESSNVEMEVVANSFALNVLDHMDGSMNRDARAEFFPELHQLYMDRDDNARQRSILDGMLAGVPHSPFEKTRQWTLLAFKHALRIAVDEGHDHIAWTTGEQQLEIEGEQLRENVSAIQVHRKGDTYDLQIQRRGGGGQWERHAAHEGIPLVDLEKYIGSELAGKAIANAEDGGAGYVLEGQQIRDAYGVGSALASGMHGYYDVAMVNDLGKYVKRLAPDAGVGELALRAASGGLTTAGARHVAIRGLDFADAIAAGYREIGPEEAFEHWASGEHVVRVVQSERPSASAQAMRPIWAHRDDVIGDPDQRRASFNQLMEWWHVDEADKKLFSVRIDEDPAVAITRQGQTVHNIPITEALAETVRESGQPLWQPGRRGGITIPPKGSLREVVFRLSSLSDISTFLHESAHFFLDMLDGLATETNPTEEILSMHADVRGWFASEADKILTYLRDQSQRRSGDITAAQYQALVDAGGADFIRAQAEAGAFGRDALYADDPAVRAAAIGMHEQFGRGYEAFGLEGNPPSKGLARAFQKFQDWLLQIYTDGIQELGVELNDDIRGVFQRLLASDEEIAEAETNVSHIGNLSDMEGFTEASARKIKMLLDEAHTNARAKLLRTLNQEVAEEEKLQRSERRQEIEEEEWVGLADDPVYQVDALLRAGRWLVDEIPGITTEKLDRSVGEQTIGDRRLIARTQGYWTRPGRGGQDPEAVAQAFGFESAGRMLEALANSPGAREEVAQRVEERMAAEVGPKLSPDEISELASEIAATEDARSRLFNLELVEIRKLQSDGFDAAARRFIADEGAEPAQAESQLVRAAEAALEEATASGDSGLIQQAMVDLRNAQSRQRASVTERRSSQARARTASSIERQVQRERKGFREAARRQMRYEQPARVKPGKYYRAIDRHRREAERALMKRDYEKAARHARARMMHDELYRAALETQKKTDRVLKALGRYKKRKVRDAIVKGGKLGTDFLGAIDATLEKYDLRKSQSIQRAQQQAATGEAAQAVATEDPFQNLAAFVRERAAAGDDMTGVPVWVLDGHDKRSWLTMSLAELEGVLDTVRTFEHRAKHIGDLVYADQILKRDEVVAESIATMEGNIRKRPGADSLKQTLGDPERGDTPLLRFMAISARMERLFMLLDGDKHGGPLMRAIFRPLSLAQARKLAMAKERFGNITASLRSMSEKGIDRLDQTVFVPEVNREFTYAEIYGVAGNLGTENNKAKMQEGEAFGRDGEAWTDAQVDAIVAHLSDEEWDHVQVIWDQFDALLPELIAMHQRSTGNVLQPIPHREFTTRSGKKMRGGYMPLIADTDRAHDSKAAQRQLELLEATGHPAWARSTTKADTDRSATELRTGARYPLKFDQSSIMNRLDRTMHDITFREPVMNAWRVLSDVRLQKTIDERMGKAFTDQLIPWLQNIAGQANVPEEIRAFSAGLAKVRRNTSLAIMGFKATIISGQLAGFANSVFELGGARAIPFILRGLTQQIQTRGQVGGLRDMVFQMSPELQNRATNIDRDFRELREQEKGRNGGKLSAAQHFAMRGIVFTDSIISIATWKAAYDMALEDGVDVLEAIERAETTVRLSQGSSAAKDLPAIMRNGEAVKWFTQIYTYGSMLLNQQWAVAHRFNQSERKIAELPDRFTEFFWLTVLAPVMNQLLTLRFPPDWEEPEEWAKWFGLLWVTDLFQGVPILRAIARDTTAQIQGIHTDFSIAPSERAFSLAADASRDLWQQTAGGDELDVSRWVDNIMLGAGYYYGVPGVGQARTTKQELIDVWNNDVDFNPIWLLYRRPRK